ncbi:MAG: hypothetical protein N2110_01475 [Flavobacteriales bacterium]|nr:hypothetical protein [Flavobacteriales bacterium]MCX7767680.1 hypothetical protein [Flavobacteriales bacterium]MDW8410957.1 hypothetical protein [Flavobacteriales bacterium]
MEVFADAGYSGSIFSKRPLEAVSNGSGFPEPTVLVGMLSLPSEYSEEGLSLRKGMFLNNFMKSLTGFTDRVNKSLVPLEKVFPHEKAIVLLSKNKRRLLKRMLPVQCRFLLKVNLV